MSTQDVILLIQYRTNDKGKSGKQWPFINEFSDSPKPEELPTTVIYIYIHTQPRPHVYPKYIDVIYPLPIFCIYVRGVISSKTINLYMGVYLQMHRTMIISFLPKENQNSKKWKAPKFPLHLKATRWKEMFGSYERQHWAKGRF